MKLISQKVIIYRVVEDYKRHLLLRVSQTKVNIGLDMYGRRKLKKLRKHNMLMPMTIMSIRTKSVTVE